MERGERFYRIHRFLKAGKCVPLSKFTSELEVSRATFNRDIEYLRDRYGAPIIWDASKRGYRYDLQRAGATSFELPGLWFNAAEIHALLVVHAMLRDLDPDLLGGQVEPLVSRLEIILETGAYSANALRQRIRFENVAFRRPQPDHFATVAQSVLQRRRLFIAHHHRGRDESSEREVSPQRLVNYRGTWYVDTWCHLRNDIRSFALDAIEKVRLIDQPAQEVPEAKLNRHLATSYGIFAGEPLQVAVLRFSSSAARWVSREHWHPEQVSKWAKDGSYEMRIATSAQRCAGPLAPGDGWTAPD